MGFYREPAQITASRRGVTRVARPTTKVRVASGGLGSIQTLASKLIASAQQPAAPSSGPTAVQSFIAKKYPGYTPPTQPTVSFRLPTSSPTPTPTPAGAFITPTTTQPRTFSPVSPAPAPAPAPTPTTSSFSPTSGPTPPQTPTDSGMTALPPAQETSPAGVVGTGSASGGAPAQYNAPTTIRFDSSSPLTMPDASSAGGPEIYNEDGTPVTPAAQTASLTDKLKKLPTIAKIGGVTLAYLLLHG